MTTRPRLLCIDLQAGDDPVIAPDARAVFGARQLLCVARRAGWSVVHTRLRREAPGGGFSERSAAALRPLTSERVFLRSRRSGADCPALAEQLEQWSHETVYVAAFDPMALLALLIDRVDRGPRFVLVEDASSAILSVPRDAAADPFAASVLALAPRTTIAALADAMGDAHAEAAGSP